jgi:protocatechuate 3,4-dioxygenase beta subunit
MSFSVRFLPVVVLFALSVVSLPASLSAQSTAKQTTKTPRGSISGRVTIKERGVPGVVLSLRKSDVLQPFGPFQRATTDQDGSYRITNVAPGSYEVTPITPAFVPAGARDNVRAKTVLVDEDENVDNINFALVRGGVITGRVTDADSRPVIQQEVNIYIATAFDRPAPQQQVFRTTAVQTDDRGIYRVYGLVPGRYKVAAGRSDDTFSGIPTRVTYRQVFHPDVSDQAKAAVIEVGEGTEANNVDIALGREIPTFSVTGRVIDASGQPVANMRFGVQRNIGPRPEFVNTFGTSNAVGDFIMEGLIPGKYVVYLFPNTGGGMRAESVPFDIIDQDVSGITIKLYKGASVSGVVVLETEDKAVLQTLMQLQLRSFVTSPTGASAAMSATSPIGPDGSFSLSGLPGGTVNFMLGAPMSPFPPKGMTITRIERDGVAMPPRALELKESEQLAGVRVIVSYGTGIINGIVKLENGSLPEGARIFLRVMKDKETINAVRPPQVDARGHFLLDGLLPGTYEVSAIVAGQTGKREVNVQNGAASDVMITIDMTAPPVRSGPPPVIRNP